MKYILSFLFGAVVGVGGTLMWLRKDIKKELEMRAEAVNEPDMPFVMGEGKDTSKEPEARREAKNGLRSDSGVNVAPISISPETKVQYNKIVEAVKSGEDPRPMIPIMPRDDISQDGEVVDKECFVIGVDDYKHDTAFEKDCIVYFRGDNIMSTENGTIIDTPAMLVGNTWEQAVGKDLDRTAFIRNPRLNTDYEIYVEDGAYEDEYGPIDGYVKDD